MTDPSVLASFLITYVAVAAYVATLFWRHRKQREDL
jgi:hypothetical protein